MNIHAQDVDELDMATTTDIEEVLLPPLYPRREPNPWNLPLEVPVKRLKLLLPDEAPFASGLDPYTDISVTAQVMQRFGEYHVYRANFQQIHELAHLEAGGHFPEIEEAAVKAVDDFVAEKVSKPTAKKAAPKKKKKLKPKAASK
jgi:hypothetical protein